MATTTAYKAVALGLTAVPGWGTFVAAEPGPVTAGQWWLLVGILSEVALVFVVPNTPRPGPWQPPAFGDDGQSTLDLVIKVAVAVIVVALAWWIVAGLIESTPHR